MKRLISIIVLMILCTSVCFAEVGKYDVSIYEDAPNYSYDKFEKTWMASSPYLHQYSDATVVIGLKIGGNANAVELPPALYAWVRDVNNTTNKYTVSGIQLLIGETVYSMPMLDAGTEAIALLSSTVGKTLLEELVKVDGISVKLKWATGSIVEEIAEDDFTELKSMAQKCLDTDIWNFVNGAVGDKKACDELIEQLWPMEVE